MPKTKSTLFNLKFAKIARRWGLYLQAVLRPQTPKLALSHYEFLAAHLLLTGAFTGHKEKDETK